MNCGRLACDNPAQGWWNETTKKFYCQPCAFAINESTPGLCVRPIECCAGNPLDYSDESEHGDLIEVEVGTFVNKPNRYIVNIMGRIGLDGIGKSEMYITDDVERIRRLRNALNRILEDYDGDKG